MRRRGGMDENDDGNGVRGREEGPQQVPHSGLSPAWVAAGIGALLLVVFAILNAERVEVDFLVFDAEVRVFSVILVSAAIGFAVGWLVGRPTRDERRRMRRGTED